MSRDDVSALLRSWGVTKAFRPVRDDGTDRETWLLETRRPAVLLDSVLTGTVIFVDTVVRGFRVWTARRVRAKALAGEHGLRVRLLSGEAELYVPAVLADELLPGFGAKVKRSLSVAQKAVLASGRANSPIFKKAH